VVIKIRAAENRKKLDTHETPPTATASGAVARPMPVEPDGPEVWPRPMQHSNPPRASNKSITINDLMAASPRKTGGWNNLGHLSTRELPGPAGRNATGKDQVRGLRAYGCITDTFCSEVLSHALNTAVSELLQELHCRALIHAARSTSGHLITQGERANASSEVRRASPGKIHPPRSPAASGD
jgi:hypothetical protein